MNEPNNTEMKPFQKMSQEERRVWIRGLMEDGTYPYQKNLTVEDIIEQGLTYKVEDWDHYRYRIQLEGVDPAVAAKYVQAVNNCNHTRFFMEAYGLERSKPYLSSYTWINAYHSSVGKFEDNAQTKRDIGLLIAERGAEKVCEEIKGRSPAEIERMVFSVTSGRWGKSFVEIFGWKAVSGLPPVLANKMKGGHLEEALGL
jgi:hypothetical protein